MMVRGRMHDDSLWGEKTCAHTPHQNGRAERVGGWVWSGGLSLLFGGNLPASDWLHCCQAYVHMRNRLPKSKWQESTPYMVLHEVADDVSEMKEQIKQFRTIGCMSQSL